MSISVIKTILPSGLKLVSVPMPQFHSCEIVVYVRMGSRYETLANNGISHFIEHLLFRGNRRYPDPDGTLEAMEDLGGSINAFTSKTAMSVNLHVLPKYLREGVELLSSYVDSPLFAGIDVERKIVVEELLDEKNPNGDDVLGENITRQLMYAEDDPLAFPIIGRRENIEGFTVDEVRSFFEKHLSIPNVVVCCAGAFDTKAFEAFAAEYFSRIPTGEPRMFSPVGMLKGGPQYRFVENDSSKNDLYVSFPGPAETSDDMYPLLLIKRYLDSGMSSVLYKRICSQLGLAYDLQVAIDAQEDATFFDVVVSASPGNIQPIVTELLTVFEGLQTNLLSEEQLVKIKQRLTHDMEYALDNPSYLGEWFGGSELYRTPEHLDDNLARIAAVTPEQIRTLARRVFAPSNRYCAVVGQKLPRALQFSL